MKTLASCILIAVVAFSASKTNYSTTSVVTLVGAKISAEQQDTVVKKYKRKDCPVCKGKGWYISGDGIAKVSCGYCEPDNESSNDSTVIINPTITSINEQ